METITDHTFGLAMYLAADYALTLECRKGYEDQSAYEATLAMTDLDVIIDYVPQFLYEELQEANEEIMELFNYFQDMEDAQTSLFEPTEFIEICKALFGLVRKGELTPIAAMQEVPYRLPEDHDIEVGALIDLSFMLTFHEKMSKAKSPKVWRYGSFLGAADFTL